MVPIGLDKEIFKSSKMLCDSSSRTQQSSISEFSTFHSIFWFLTDICKRTRVYSFCQHTMGQKLMLMSEIGKTNIKKTIQLVQMDYIYLQLIKVFSVKRFFECVFWSVLYFVCRFLEHQRRCHSWKQGSWHQFLNSCIFLLTDIEWGLKECCTILMLLNLRVCKAQLTLWVYNIYSFFSSSWWQDLSNLSSKSYYIVYLFVVMLMRVS